MKMKENRHGISKRKRYDMGGLCFTNNYIPWGEPRWFRQIIGSTDNTSTSVTFQARMFQPGLITYRTDAFNRAINFLSLMLSTRWNIFSISCTFKSVKSCHSLGVSNPVWRVLVSCLNCWSVWHCMISSRILWEPLNGKRSTQACNMVTVTSLWPVEWYEANFVPAVPV